MRPITLLCLVSITAAPAPVPWHDASVETLAQRFAPPAGLHRVEVPPESFGAWLRRLPLRPAGAPVRLFDGRLKDNQAAHVAVLALDVGARDLQQCADAVIRLRAEYLREAGHEGDVCFRFTSGDAAPWSRWRAGERPVVRRKVRWEPRAAADASYASFRAYLDAVFEYAGTASLARELRGVALVEPVAPGDVFIRGGSPGHAVLVVDVAAGPAGERVFLLAQSYMPAQEIQVLRNPAGDSPWYATDPSGPLVTPEWTFAFSERRRFAASGCP